MGPEVFVYPFLFIAIFFEVFVLLTFLSAPARTARGRQFSGTTPSVAIIIPCHNEENTVVRTIESVLALSYPKDKLEVIVVDNGSTDGTPAVITSFSTHPNVTIVREERLGKHHAVNAGIMATQADIVGCLDADSVVDPDALKEAVTSFYAPDVAATTAAMSVHEPKTSIQHMQHAEYTFSIFLRHTLASVNGLYVTPGPFSLYRRTIVNELGGFREGHHTEDLEMALRIQRAGYKIENAPRARVYTQTPLNIRRLIRQRTRWTTGFLRNVLNEYRDLIGNRTYGTLGTLVLPLGLLAIASGIIVFCLSLFLFIREVVQFYFLHQGIPVSFLFSNLSFEWFYVPISIYTTLAIITVCITLVLMSVGKRMSGTPGSLLHGILAYLFLYGFIAPLWLMRATADVVIGARRRWR